MRLFGSYTSPFVRHCRIVLNQLDAPSEFVEASYQDSGKDSPTMKVPYFKTAQDELLTDSSSIVAYLRKEQGIPFISEPEEWERYALINTLLDTSINLFLLAKEGLTPETSDYLKRQQKRADTLMNVLEQSTFSFDPESDNDLRLACCLEWMEFRGVRSIAPFKALSAFLEAAKAHPDFAATAPPS